DGTIRTANDNFLATVGYTLGEIQGRHHRMFVDRDYANSEEYAAFWDTLNTGSFASGEFRRVDKSGRDVWIQASYNPIFDRDGNAFKVVKYAVDITARKQALQALEASILALAEGDLTRRVDDIEDKDFVPLRDAMNHSLDQLQTVMRQVKNAAELVTGNTSRVVNGSQQLQERVAQLTGATQGVAATMTQLTSTLKHNARSSELASKGATDAQERASQGGDVVQLANQAMLGIEETSQEISEIIGVIDEIAFQTNLVALNAAMEAARAGDHGRGFAVVAGEIRFLARQCSEGADDIKAQIQRSRQRVAEGSRHVKASGEVLDQIVASVTTVNEQITGVETMSHEQALAVEQVEGAIAEIRDANQRNAAFVAETVDSSKEMSEASRQLAQAVGHFQLVASNPLEPA
ncbi:MAG: methyl-accepting chemotaxis protein, partial [Myxococcota bacterium]